MINLYTLKGTFILTFENELEVATVFETSEEEVKQCLEKYKTLCGYQVRRYRNTNDIAPAPEYFCRTTTTYFIKNKIGEIIDMDTDLNELAAYYGVSTKKLENAYSTKTLLFNKYKVDKTVEVITNNKNEFLS